MTIIEYIVMAVVAVLVAFAIGIYRVRNDLREFMDQHDRENWD